MQLLPRKQLFGSAHFRDLTKSSTPDTENDSATQTDNQKTKLLNMVGREADVKIGEDMAKDPLQKL